MEKIIHQIWVGKYQMPDREHGFIQKVIENNPSYKHILWNNDNIPELPQNLKEVYDAFGNAKDYAHQADVLRVYLVKTFGGIYIDVDFDCIYGFENTNYHEYEGLFLHHGGKDYTIPNGAFGCSANHPLINYIFEQIDKRKWGWFGPSWMGNMVREYYGLPHECEHNLLIPKLNNDNINYRYFHEFEKENCRHHALYSWSPENRRNFESGNINYLK